MNTLTALILKQIAGGLHIEHHHKDTEEKIKDKVNDVKDNVSDAYDDLGLPTLHVESK